jgi:hypothetical protein
MFVASLARMRDQGFSYIEVLISLSLFLGTLLFVGSMNMTSLHLLGKGKLNQRATLLLLEKIEELRVVPIDELTEGEFEAAAGSFVIRWKIQNDTPYFGTKQVVCRVLFQPAATVIVESIFYRSE